MVDSARRLRTELRQRQIVDLEAIVQELPDNQRAVFNRLYAVSSSIGRLVPPDHMRRWIDKYFGGIEAVSEQKVIKVTNCRTLEGSLFNELRARRPLEARIPADLADEIARTAPDPFCEPELNTPADTFGRIRGASAITASNIAKYDGFHGVVIFAEHDPLAFTQNSVHDAMSVSKQWFARCHEEDSTAVYPLIMWNCLWKSGASIPHGHMQVSLSRDMHYGQIERQRRTTTDYRRELNASFYDDTYAVHEALGLGVTRRGVKVMAHLTPRKEKECLIVGDALDDSFVGVLYDVLHCLTDVLNVVSFNLVVWMPPMVDTGEDWSDFPVVARMVDRGDPLNRTADFGAMELYAASVVSSDPFRVADALWSCLGVE
ncbi:MAG TPA: hypothetical protein VMM78_15740 [Thermomicrobiales bacterium]|nr:hypothetical protein [Thermomicrobiales bacterium]